MILANVEVWFLCIQCGAEYKATFKQAYAVKPRCWGCGGILTAAGKGVTPGAPEQ